jgi:hypothetical protein
MRVRVYIMVWLLALASALAQAQTNYVMTCGTSGANNWWQLYDQYNSFPVLSITNGALTINSNVTVSGTVSGNGASLTSLQATNMISTIKLITNGYSLTANDSVVICYGTNELVTNNLTTVGKIVTIICKSTNGSVIITNTSAAIFTVPGLGNTTNAVYLGSWWTTSNSWTGVYDGVNW